MPMFDVVIVGAGIAGASLAAELVSHLNVLVVEAEDTPGYHSTGRSAAFWSESYGGPDIQPLTTASGPFLAQPPAEFSDRGFLHPRGALTLARADEVAELLAFEQAFDGSGVRFEPLDRAALEQHVPGLAEDIVAGLFEPDCSDIDVGGLHGCYLAAARRGGAVIKTRMPLMAARWQSGLWSLSLGGETVETPLLVNAAGAWADPVAQIAGVQSMQVQPLRRTIVQLRTNPPAPAALPLTLGVKGDYYFKPEAGRVWLSPHDETPEAPGDSAPTELDVAIAIDRFTRIVDWKIEAIEHRWSGLRSFAPDRLPVIGYAPDHSAFFWFAGQGGFGIQTAPAAAKLAASLILSTAPDGSLAGVDVARYLPSRF